MIENYIFDLYGTLVDIHTDETKPSFWKRVAILYSLQGAAYGPDELRAAYHAAVEMEMDRLAAAFPSIPREHVEPDILKVFGMLYDQKGVKASAEKISDTALFFRTLSLAHLRLYPGVREILAALRARGKGVYLLSNAQAAFTVPELNKLGLVSCFDGIVLSSDAGVKKPDKAIFERLLSNYGLRPGSCVMVGNDQQADMWGAATVAMAGRYIHTKLSPDRSGPLPPNCREIGSLRELL